MNTAKQRADELGLLCRDLVECSDTAIAEAVAAERRRAAEAVREIVERRMIIRARMMGSDWASHSDIRQADSMVNLARECLAAVEGKA